MMKKLISFVLILAFAFGIGFGGFCSQGGNFAFAMGAVDFTDVNQDYWGYSYIDFSASNGIINGYQSPNGTYQFLPENSVTREEAMSMLYRALAAAGTLESTEDFSTDYEELFLENKIADWSEKYVSYGLKYGLIEEDELADFTDENGYGIPAPREQVAYWTAKALKKNLTPAYSLDYVDKDSISTEMLPYIDLLYRQGIMQGDDTKKFNPASGIKRVEFAAICNRVFELVKVNVYSIEKETQSYRGTIVSVDTINNKIMMTLSDGTNRVIQSNPKSQIVIDGKLEYNGIKGIKTGSVSIVAWGSFSELQLHIATKTQTRTGLLKDIEVIDDNTSILKIRNGDGNIIQYISDYNTKAATTLKQGKEVTFIADGVKILEIK